MPGWAVIYSKGLVNVFLPPQGYTEGLRENESHYKDGNVVVNDRKGIDGVWGCHVLVVNG